MVISAEIEKPMKLLTPALKYGVEARDCNSVIYFSILLQYNPKVRRMKLNYLITSECV